MRPAGSRFDIDLAVTSLPLAAEQFTDIVSRHVVEHLDCDPTVLDLLRECRRIMKPGGRI